MTIMISMCLEDSFLKEIDETVKRDHYQNRTEFIRSSLRQSVKESEMKRFAEGIMKLKGSAKRKVSEEEYEKARQQSFDEVSRMIKKGIDQKKDVRERYFR